MTSPRVPDSAFPRAPYPRIVRPVAGRVFGGVAAGVALHLGVPVAWVRALFAALLPVAGLSGFVYVLLWLFVPSGPVTVATVSPRMLRRLGVAVPQAPWPAVAVAVPGGGVCAVPARVERHAAMDAAPVPVTPTAHRGWWRVLGVAAAVMGAVMTLSANPVSIGVMVPLLAVVTGAVLAWGSYERSAGAGDSSLRPAVFMGGGAALVLLGIVIVAVNWEKETSWGAPIMAVLVTLVGVAGLGVPLWVRLWGSLMEERMARAAAAERAEIAARLHDSVLQTLALIQKRCDDPAMVARLARGQERQLRGWLFDAPTVEMSAHHAIASAAGEVEDLFGLRVEVVTVGADVPPSPVVEALAGAAREAMVNAAKHAQVDRVDVFVETFGGEVEVFVRDRGVGFDEQLVAADRQGIASSIRGRMAQVGGSVQIRSSAGFGTEVALSAPVPAAD